MNATCLCHGAAVADGAYACPPTASQARENLRQVVTATPDARETAWAVTGARAGAGQKPGSRSPGNDDALDALTTVQNTLNRWSRVCAEHIEPPDAEDGQDQIVRAAQFLTECIEWLRHKPFVLDAFAEFADCANALRFTVEGAPEKRYLGECGAAIPTATADDGFVALERTCKGRVTGRVGGDKATCAECGAVHSQKVRIEWMRVTAREWAYTPKQIHDAYPHILPNTIAQWRKRGRLTPVSTEGQVHRYRLADVLTLAGHPQETAA